MYHDAFLLAGYQNTDTWEGIWFFYTANSEVPLQQPRIRFCELQGDIDEACFAVVVRIRHLPAVGSELCK